MKWYNYDLKWCHECSRPYIECDHCAGISCETTDCEYCRDEFAEFRRTKWSRVSTEEQWEDIVFYDTEEE